MNILENKIKSRVTKITENKYENEDLLKFFHDNNGNNETIKIENFIIVYYLSYYKETDLSKIYNEVYELSDTIREFCCTINEVRIDDSFNIDISRFNNTVLGEERYYHILQRILKFAYYSTSELYNEMYTLFKKLNISHNEVDKKIRTILEIDDTIECINNRYKELNSECKKVFKKNSSEMEALVNISKELNYYTSKGGLITINMNNLKNIDSDEIKYEILRVVNSINNNYFIDIYTENKKLKINNIAYLKYIFKENGFDIDKLPDNMMQIIVNYGDLIKILDILELLKNIDYNVINLNSKEGLECLVSTNNVYVKTIISMLHNGTINSEFILKNSNIFYDINIVNKKCGYYSKIVNNYNILNNNKFNLNNSIINDGLFTLNEDIENNITLFNRYDLNKEKKLTKDFLINNSFFKYIDSFIEIGLNEFIKDNFNIINKNCDKIIKRIYISKLMHIKIFDDNGQLIDSIKTGNDFYISDSNLDDYIISISDKMIDPNINNCLNKTNYSKFDNEDFTTFDKEFMLDKDCYVFENIIISRNKVIRNYNCLKRHFPEYNDVALLEYSIIHNSYLDIDSIYKISNQINNFYDNNKKRIYY